MARKINRRLYDLNSPFTAKDIDKSKYSRKAAESLVLWLQMTSESPTNRANNSLSAEYEGTPAISFEPILLGPKKRNVATFSDSGNSNIKVASNIALSHSKLGNGGTPYEGSDLPFSVSAWVRFDDIETGEPHYIFAKDDGSYQEYYLYHGIDQKFTVALNDTANSKFQQIKSSAAVTPSDFNGKWNHVVVTYDGRGGDSAYLGIKMYINGAEHAVSDDGSESGYVGMRPNTGTGTGEFYVADAYGAGAELDGSMSEFAMWKGHALSQSEVAAIYSITQYGDSEVSGIISNPVRVLLQTEDNRTGSYPTVARPGDHDFSGKFPSIFDDTKVVEFGGTENMLYPLGVNSSSPFISGGIASPNILNGIIAPGTASAGIADLHVRFTPGENISPFDESRVYIDESIGFYATGTITGTMEGFTQRLASKESIVIDLEPSIATSTSFSTGSTPNAAGKDGGIDTGIVYFNFENKVWEVIGDLTTGSNIDIMNGDESVRRNGKCMLAFAPSGLQQVRSGDYQAIYSYIGLPVTSYGFPFAGKYDATGSQMYCMSSSITAPFLVEKISIEFSASFGPEYIYNRLWGPCVKQFFLLNQFDNTDRSDATVFPSKTFPSFYANTSYTTDADNFSPFAEESLGKTKDLVAVGEISMLPMDPTKWSIGEPPISAMYRDLNISREDSYGANSDSPVYPAITGTYRVEFTPKVYANQEVLGVVPLSKTADRNSFWGGGSNPGALYGTIKSVVGSDFGGRQLTNDSCGYSFVNAVAGTRPSGTMPAATVTSFQQGGETWSTRPVPKVFLDGMRQDAPYVLTPNSKIVVGFSNTPNLNANGYQAASDEDHLLGEFATARANAVLSPGAGKMTLYGSYLQNNLPKEGQSNQPLNTDAIHECLQSDIPVYDQWDVEPYAALSGSYVDNVITGSMLARLAGSFEDPIHIPDVRIVKYSVAAGQAGDQGSLQRFVRLTDHSVFAYDSVPPDAVEVVGKSGAGLLIDSGDVGISVAAPTTSLQDSLGAALKMSDSSWYLRTAYEVSSRRFVRSSYFGASGEAFNSSNASVGSMPISVPFTNQVLFSGSLSTLAGDGQGSFETRGAFPSSVKYLWGFGDGAFNLPEAVGFDGTTSTPLIRGYKYGLGGLFGSSQDARFRRDRFGQFRDMLEPRRQTATMTKDGAGLDFTIDIRFVPRDNTEGGTVNPEETHSQNLDTHSSSSLPYYDGLFVDRPDNPDLTLTPVVVS